MISFYQTTGPNGVGQVVALGPDGLKAALSTHPSYEEILAGLEAGDESVFDLFDIGVGMTKKFRQVTERVSWDGVNILWDGDPVKSVLGEQLKRAIQHGNANFTALAKFWEKLESNPNAHSKEMAYEWLANHEFKITEDGDVIGYKGISAAGFSTRAGHAFVDGKEFLNDYIPNEDGTVVSMPRSEVAHDPAAACHTGLHIGDWSFGSTFGGARTKMVTFNPRDICSVPDHAHKVRVCKYKVICDVTAPAEGGPVLNENEVSWVPDALTTV